MAESSANDAVGERTAVLVGWGCFLCMGVFARGPLQSPLVDHHFVWLDVRITQKEKEAKHAKVCVSSTCLRSHSCLSCALLHISPQESLDLRKELQASSERVKELTSEVEAAYAENTALHAVSDHVPR
jgi:hypothetical protein